jgi:hypothetical protein
MDKANYLTAGAVGEKDPKVTITFVYCHILDQNT